MSITWFDGVTLTVEAALSAEGTSVYGRWGSGKWGTFTWGPDVVWTDLSDRLRSITVSRKFSRYLQVWEAGTAQVRLDNTDGALSPDNLSGPYMSAGVTQIRPGRPFRLTMSYGGTAVRLFVGYSTAWDEGWIQAGPQLGDAWVDVSAADEWSILSGIDGVEVAAVGAGDTFGARLHRILDAAGRRDPRSISTGVTTMQATTLAGGPTSDIKATVESEGGAAWIDRNGTFRASDKYSLSEDAVSNTVQATFGDGGAGSGEVAYDEIKLAYTTDTVMNQAVYTRTGGTAQSCTDDTSRALYQLRRETKTGLLCQTDAEVLLLAQWAVARFKDPESRFESMSVNPRSDPTVIYPLVRDLQERHLITVSRLPPGGHVISRSCHIAGVSHTITPSTWQTAYDLWSASPYLTYASSHWGVGKWGTFKWFN